MTYRELIKKIGYAAFEKYGKGWYSLDYVVSHGLDDKIDRYALLGMRPFYEVNRLYNTFASDKNMDIGSTYDWLNETLEDENELNLYLVDIMKYL